MESIDMTAQNIEKIGALFPNCITETVDDLVDYIQSEVLAELRENYIDKVLSIVVLYFHKRY